MAYRDKEQQKKYQRQWVARRRAEFFVDKICVICGSTEKLELDHIDPSTKDSSLKKGTGLWSWSKERRDAEISKCQVLCENCHLEKTIQQFTFIKHGTRNTYMKHKCRCDDCILAASIHRQNQRNKLYEKTRFH